MTSWKRDDTMGGRNFIIALLLIAAGLVALGSFVGESDAELSPTTFDVGSGKNYTTIQSAINAASNGDVIRIYNGTYNENVVVNKTLTIVGEGADITIIDGGGTSSAMMVQSDNSRIGGLAFTGSILGGDLEKAGTAGLLVQANNTLIQNCTFYDNYFGVILRGGDQFTDNRIVYSEAYHNEAHGIGLGVSSTIQGCYSHDNNGSGFWAFVTPDSLLERCRAENNGYMGFQFDHTEDTTVIEFIARNNSAYGIAIGGGGVGYGNSVEKSLLEKNGEGGLKLRSLEGPLNIWNNTIRDNVGSGINFSGSVGGSQINVCENRIWDNQWYGIQINSGCQDVRVYRNDLIDNNGGTSTQGFDNTSGNLWDMNGRGNHWDDWTTPDANSDGIVDNPYVLHGSVSQQDNLPLTTAIFQTDPLQLSNDLWEGGKFYTDFGVTFPGPPVGDDDDVDPPDGEDGDWVMLSGGYEMHDYYMWSHDSESVAFHFNDGETWGICTVDVEVMEPIRITGSSEYSYVPFWHPDDSKICYWEYEYGNTRWGEEGPNLYVMNSDGTENQKLTSSYTIRKHSYADGGNSIVYFSCENNMNGWFELFRAKDDGSDAQTIASHGVSALLSVSPDGKKVAYDGRPNWNQIGSIYVMNVDGSDDHLVHESIIHGTVTSDFTTMSWSGDGTSLVFTDNKDSSREIYTIKEDGTGLNRLTNNDREDSIVNGDSFQVWNPVTNKIVYTSLEHGNWDVFVMDPDGSNKERITFSDSNETDALWAPDGTKIAFMSNYEGGKKLYYVEYSGGEPVDPDSDDDVDPGYEGVPDIEFQKEPYHEDSDQEVRVPEDFLEVNDDIHYEWYIEGYGYIGSGESIDLNLPAGTYNLTLVGKNSDDEEVFTVSREFLVRAPVDEGSGFLEKLMKNKFTWIIFIIALVLIIIILGFVLGKRKRSEKNQAIEIKTPDTIPEQRITRSPIPNSGSFVPTEEVVAGKLEEIKPAGPYRGIGAEGIPTPIQDEMEFNEMKALNEAIDIVKKTNNEGTSMERSRAKLEEKYREGALGEDEFRELSEILDKYMK